MLLSVDQTNGSHMGISLDCKGDVQVVAIVNWPLYHELELLCGAVRYRAEEGRGTHFAETLLYPSVSDTMV